MDRARDLVEVHLDDDAAAVPRASDASHRPRRGRRLAVIALAVAALAVGAGAVTQHARDRARDAELATVDGLMPALDGAPVEVWRADASWVSAQVGDVLLVSDADGTSSALDADSGDVLWTDDGAAAWAHSCTPLDADPDDASTPPSISPTTVWLSGTWPTAPGGALVCVWSEPDGTTAVALVDPATGRRDAAMMLPGSVITHQVRDGEVVVATSTDGALEVARWDPASGVLRWELTAPGVLGTSESWSAWTDPAAGTLTVSGDAEITVSLDTGEEVATAGDPVPASPLLEPVTQELPDGSVLTWQTSDVGSFPYGSGEVTGPDGAAGWALPGPPVMPAITDGSEPEVVVVQATPLTAAGLDVRTGAELWSADGLEAAGIVQMDGTLVVRDSVGVRALDVRTGEERWTAGAPRTPITAGQTDGRLVLLGAREDGQTLLVARRIADGEQVWSVPVPEGTWNVHRLGDGGLLALGGAEVVRLDLPVDG